MRIIGLEDAARHSVKDPVAAERKAENVREVVAALANFEKAEPESGLGDYLAGVNLSGRDEESDDFSGDSVTLLTMHGAKGLEYPHVFLTGLEEGLLPHRRSEFEVGGLEEERRLAYVGMTRARRSLTITYAAARTKYAKQEKASPSRFLEELPEEGVRREDRRDPRAGLRRRGRAHDPAGFFQSHQAAVAGRHGVLPVFQAQLRPAARFRHQPRRRAALVPRPPHPRGGLPQPRPAVRRRRAAPHGHRAAAGLVRRLGELRDRDEPRPPRRVRPGRAPSRPTTTFSCPAPTTWRRRPCGTCSGAPASRPSS